MSGRVTVLGVRHHGPGSARMVQRALAALDPDAVLIEGPPDAADVLALAARDGMKPPVALLVYEPDEPKNAAYYPFAEFSPEWQAIRWAVSAGRDVRFIDLPFSQRRGADLDEDDPADEQHHEEDKPESSADPLESLANAAGFADGEAWWGRLIEERRGNDNPLGVFDAIREAMASARAELGDSRRDRDEPAREAHMRRCIREALKDGRERIAVVCGAWHAPVLTEGALGEIAVKDDAGTLKGLPKRRTAATWVPWSYERLSMFSGYGAGIASPGWYDHLWRHREQISESWLTRVARLMRDEDLDASPASVIEAVRLADSLAAMRGRATTGLGELGEATLAILCHGNPLPMRVIERALIVGNRLGEVPEDVPTVPLQRDLASLQKSLRLKVSPDEHVLDLDQRKEMDLARSRLLHRLSILGINWGELQADQMQRTSTFHEIWRLKWRPELAVSVMDAARWGNTVEEAAAARVGERVRTAKALGDLTGLLDHVILADLPGVVQTVVSRIQAMAAVGSEVGAMMDALPPLARIQRYGSVRRTDAALVEPVLNGLVARICAGLLPACASLDDDAAAAIRGRIDAVHGALSSLDNAAHIVAWRQELRKVGDAEVHGLVAGRAWRLLLDAGAEPPEEAATRLSLALSPGNDPGKSSAWLEGFLGGSGALLVHDDRLLAIVDAWLGALTREVFEQVCPIVRRTFSTFEKPERRRIGEKVARGSGGASAPEAVADDYDPERGALVDPVLKLILGEDFR
jgi:hypothetical protein